MIGTTIGPYTVLEKLGGGGMGVVYRAHDEKLDRPVALKSLPAELAEDEVALERFTREARAAARLNHPNICTVHDLLRDEEGPLLVMELLEGETLKPIVARGQPLAPAKVAEIGLQIAGALAAAHKARILHRDIKPANIFLTEHGVVKLLDFGLAKQSGASADATTEVGLTQAGTAVGTIAYMSPEQARGEPVDPRSDLYSLGVVLYELATARHPFPGDSAAVVFDQILNKEARPAVALNPELPDELSTILGRLLNKDREARYPSAAELQSDLSTLAQPTTGSQTSTESSGPPRWPLRVGSAIAVLGLLAALALFTLGRDRQAALPESAQGGQPTVGVLPFQNLGAHASYDYLALAVPDEIATTLTYAPSLAVRPFAQSAAYRDAAPDLARAGSELRAANLITGQFYEEAGDLQITLEAINVDENRVLWRSSFAVPAADVIALRQQVAGRVRDELVPKLGARITGAATAPQNAEAYELYLRSLAVERTGGEENQRAVAMLERAAELDPTFAPTLAELGIRLYYEGHFAAGGEEVMRRSEEASRKALALDPDLMDSVLQLGTMQADRGELVGAFQDATAFLTRRPNSAELHYLRSYIYRYAGLLEEAHEDCHAALRLDPTNYRWRACAIAFASSNLPEESRLFIQLDPASDLSRDMLARLELQAGNEAAARELLAPIPSTYVFQPQAGALEHCHRQSHEARAAATRAAAAARAVVDPEPKYWMAAMLSYCGQKADALDLLREAVEMNYCSYPAVDLDPLWAPLRGDPDFLEVRERARACRDRFARLLVPPEEV